jgi:hypothetical protein
LTLTRLSVVVSKKTNVWATLNGRPKAKRTKSHSRQIYNFANDDFGALVTSEAGYSTLFVSAAVRGTVPSFKTLNLKTSYGLRVMVSFTCVEMILTVEEESGLLVLPRMGDYGAPLKDDVQ